VSAEAPTPQKRHPAPSRQAHALLPLVPFVAVVAVYLIASYLRLADNPQDKILPSLAQMGDAVVRLAFTPDPQTGAYLWWEDTFASLRRLGLGVGIAASLAKTSKTVLLDMDLVRGTVASSSIVNMTASQPCSPASLQPMTIC